jgi:PAS domain S-box-containing protein
MKRGGFTMEHDPRFRARFDQESIGFALIDRETSLLVKVNEKFCDLVGIEKAAAERTTFMEIGHPEDMKDKLLHVHELLEGGLEVLTVEKSFRRKDGSSISCNLTLCPLRDIDGEFGYYLALVEDITKKKRVERQLQEKVDLLEQHVEYLEAELEQKTRESKSVTA